MIDQAELRNLLSTAINAAVRAGKLILDVYNSNEFQVNLKSDKTPLTLADRQAHNEILNSLTKTRIPTLSEEGRNILFEERKGWEYFWLVDPLDGTKEFIKRNGEFTVNIALIVHGYPIIGVVYVPVLKELYFSLKGDGAFKATSIEPEMESNYRFDQLAKTSEQLPKKIKREKLVVLSSRSHMNSETEEFIAHLEKKYGGITHKYQGSSLKLCLIAEGCADIYPRFTTTMEWDTAAGQAIVEETGCHILTADTKQRISYNKENLQNPWFIVKADKTLA
ncbi:MAG TPA: 3'(2'),5'-bisphosphate nucleotidase [Bacteroidales bacterium]|nr:3'(2'),5'-bisphosphate nucleotidase [Bacteroidales bacterium]